MAVSSGEMSSGLTPEVTESVIEEEKPKTSLFLTRLPYDVSFEFYGQHNLMFIRTCIHRVLIFRYEYASINSCPEKKRF